MDFPFFIFCQWPTEMVQVSSSGNSGESLRTCGKYLIKTHDSTSQILKGRGNVKYCFTKQHLVKKFKQHVKEINLETQAPPCFYTPDVKTSCSFTSAYISNLWTICLKHKSCCIKKIILWTNRILLDRSKLRLFEKSCRNELFTGHPLSAGPWAQNLPMICSPGRSSLHPFFTHSTLLLLPYLLPGLSPLRLEACQLSFPSEHTVDLKDSPVSFMF